MVLAQNLVVRTNFAICTFRRTHAPSIYDRNFRESRPHLGHKTLPPSCIFGGEEKTRATESAGLMRCTANSVPTALCCLMIENKGVVILWGSFGEQIFRSSPVLLSGSEWASSPRLRTLRSKVTRRTLRNYLPRRDLYLRLALSP